MFEICVKHVILTYTVLVVFCSKQITAKIVVFFDFKIVALNL